MHYITVVSSGGSRNLLRGGLKTKKVQLAMRKIFAGYGERVSASLYWGSGGLAPSGVQVLSPPGVCPGGLHGGTKPPLEAESI